MIHFSSGWQNEKYPLVQSAVALAWHRGQEAYTPARTMREMADPTYRIPAPLLRGGRKLGSTWHTASPSSPGLQLREQHLRRSQNAYIDSFQGVVSVAMALV